MITILIRCMFNLKGHEDQARKVLRDLQNDEKVIDQRIQDYIELNSLHQDANFWSSIQQKGIMRNLVIVLGLFIIQAFTGKKF